MDVVQTWNNWCGWFGNVLYDVHMPHMSLLNLLHFLYWIDEVIRKLFIMFIMFVIGVCVQGTKQQKWTIHILNFVDINMIVYCSCLVCDIFSVYYFLYPRHFIVYLKVKLWFYEHYFILNNHIQCYFTQVVKLKGVNIIWLKDQK